jgi:hypothetical protein
MKRYKQIKQSTNVLRSIICDKCNKEYDSNNIPEIQEFLHIDFTGGYGSVFGDGKNIEYDICQHCLFEIINGF